MYVFDIDNTISIPGDRLKHIQGPRKNWDAFYDGCDVDHINIRIALIATKILDSRERIIYCTGRPERVRQKTLKWLVNFGLYDKNCTLLMRKDNDFRKDYIIKLELLAPYQEEITAVFEDRSSVVNALREAGYTCLQVAAGEY